MLFRESQHGPIRRGEVTLTVRRWRRPQAKVGGRYRVGDGLIEVDRIATVAPGDVTAEDACRAGFASRAALMAIVGAETPGTALYRVEFHFAGPDDRPGPPAHDAALTVADLEAIGEKLARMDVRASTGPWTTETLLAIDARPGTRAADLARKLGRDTLPFKADVRRLKRLGLTESLDVGYQISPRGRAYLDAIRARAR